MYRWDGTQYVKTVVDDFTDSHAKEILAVDMNGKGKAELFSVVEAATEVQPDGTARVVRPVEIRHYTLKKDGTFEHEVIYTIDDKQCRFLVPGDFNQDGKMDLVAASLKKGLWLVTQGADGKWSGQNFETNSSGFEHTTYAADLDGNGVLELYVAADDQHELRQYVWNTGSKSFDRTVIGPIQDKSITWNLTAASF